MGILLGFSYSILQIFGFCRIPLLGELRRISFSTFKLRNVSIFAT